jgi:hypothetical protein
MARVVFLAASLYLALSGVAHAPQANAQTGMRCGTKLVGEGDSTYRVRQLCGDPASAVRRVEFHTERVPVAPHPSGKGYVYSERTVEVVIDEWLYDFGPHQFVRRLRFEQDRLVNTATEKYGTAR